MDIRTWFKEPERIRCYLGEEPKHHSYFKAVVYDVAMWLVDILEPIIEWSSQESKPKQATCSTCLRPLE